MKANHFHAGIVFSVALLITAAAMGQFKTISVTAPPEIKLMPLPSRAFIFLDLDSNGSQVARLKKEKMIDECADSMLSIFTRAMTDLLPAVEFIALPAPKIDSETNPVLFLRKYQADLALGIADFRPEVVQREVTTTEEDNHGKSKTAAYSMIASGVLRIYNADSLIRSFPFSESRFLQERAVISGLFAAGPSLVKNKKKALEVTDDAACHLAERFVSQHTVYTISLFKKKELKEVTDLIENDNYEEALQKALQLTTHENDAIASRAFYLCALLYHIKMDFAKAFEYAEQARKVKKIVTMEEWHSYYYYLKKYAVDNEVIWKTL